MPLFTRPNADPLGLKQKPVNDQQAIALLSQRMNFNPLTALETFKRVVESRHYPFLTYVYGVYVHAKRVYIEGNDDPRIIRMLYDILQEFMRFMATNPPRGITAMNSDEAEEQLQNDRQYTAFMALIETATALQMILQGRL